VPDRRRRRLPGRQRGPSRRASATSRRSRVGPRPGSRRDTRWDRQREGQRGVARSRLALSAVGRRSRGDRRPRHEHTAEHRRLQRPEARDDPNDAAMLLIDHQSGLFQVVKDPRVGAARRLHHLGQGGDASEHTRDHECLRAAEAERPVDPRGPPARAAPRGHPLRNHHPGRNARRPAAAFARLAPTGG